METYENLNFGGGGGGEEHLQIIPSPSDHLPDWQSKLIDPSGLIPPLVRGDRMAKKW